MSLQQTRWITGLNNIKLSRQGWLARAIILAGLICPGVVLAQPAIELLTSAGSQGEQVYTVSLQVLAMMTAMVFLPAALMLTTAFTRIVIVLAILRQGLGTMQAPSNQVLIGVALFMTMFIMRPVFERAYSDAIEPYINEEISVQQALKTGVEPFREFMLGQTRQADLDLFIELSRAELKDDQPIPLTMLIPAYATSELMTAFQMGFMILLPFMVIDLVVASVLMTMGMMMLSPMLISFPFKLMLFVLIDGWSLVMATLAQSFY